MKVHYNRDIGRVVYRWGLFKDQDLMILFGVLIFGIFAFTILQAIGLFCLCLLYISIFHTRKPRGYDIHFFTSLVRNRIFTNGKEEVIFHERR